jgi:hypothetical protein
MIDVKTLLEPGTEVLDQYKAGVTNPDLSTLSEGQSKSFADLNRFVFESTDTYILLEGYAGTGKTYLLSKFIQSVLYRDTDKNAMIALAAPTNRAVRVLNNMCDFDDDRIVCKTIHSLLKIKPKLNVETGEMDFVPDLDAKGGLGYFTICIIDEVSQLNDSIFEMLTQFAGKGVKFIFTGDGLQIPPIGQVFSIPFDESKRAFYGIGKTGLTQILRQGTDNPIVQMSMKIRDKVKRPNIFPIKNNNFDTQTGKGYQWVNKGKAYEMFEDTFTSDYLTKPNGAKVLAYRRDTVSKYNSYIRRLLFPQQWKSKIAIGEKLIAKSTILDEDSNVIFPTYEEFEVQKFELKSRKLAGVELTYYKVWVVSKSVEGMEQEIITVIHEKSEEGLKRVKKAFYDAAKKETEHKKRKEKFTNYHAVKNFFASIGYNYAWTVHTSQGATIPFAFVDWKDIEVNRNIFERNRIKYTAVTRVQDSVHLINSYGY